jgi:hypothetical protein
MKKRRLSKKLELRKETLRKLTPTDLENVFGGDDPASVERGGDVDATTRDSCLE